MLVGYPPEDLVLKPALCDHARHALEQLARDTADGGPALVVGAPWREPDGALYNARLPAAWRRGRRPRVQARAAELRRVRREAGVRGGPDPGAAAPCRSRAAAPSGSASWSARTCGPRTWPRAWARAGREILVVPNGSPFEHGKRRPAAAAGGGAGHRDRAAAALRQPGRRPGRAGVRRRARSRSTRERRLVAQAPGFVEDAER